jgi:hypothetical protein
LTTQKKESLTIDQYLNGCNCQTIYFNAGGCTLVLTNLEDEHSKLIYPTPDNKEMLLGNDLTITRFSTEKNNKLIEIQIKAEYGHLFYMMYPTGTFVHKETF